MFIAAPSLLLSKGYFFTGDGAYRSKDGHYQIIGRLDDVINVSGHRIGTAELEDVVVCTVRTMTLRICFQLCLKCKIAGLS